MKAFNIRNIQIDPPLILSPMAGVTDYTFRRLIKRRGGVGLVVSEFISVEGLTRHNPKSKRQMRFDEEERPYAVQIFGGNPDRMAMGAEMAEEIGADILDVNCGCPAPKVVKNGGGSGLLRDTQLLVSILTGITRLIRIPSTLKRRTGYSEASINLVEFLRSPMKPPQIQLKRENDLLVLRLEGDYTLECAEYVQRHLEEISKEYGYRMIMIDVRRAGTVTSDARRLLRANRNQSRYPSVVAIVGANFAVRTLAHMVLTALRTLTKTSLGVQFFADENSARAWIDSQRNRLRIEITNHFDS